MSKQKTIDMQDVKARLRSQIRTMFRDLDAYRRRWTLIISEMGTGKTTLIAKALARSGLRFLWLAGSHRNLTEIETIIYKAVRLSDEELANAFCQLTGMKTFINASKENCIKDNRVLDTH